MKKNYNCPITDCVEINALGVLMASQVEANSVNNAPSAMPLPNKDNGTLF